MKLSLILQSDPDALYRQALDLMHGKVGDLTLESAHRLFSVAALMDMHAARYHLGLMNLRGEGRERDRIRALMWFRLAGTRDEPRAARQASELASDLKPVDIRKALQSATRFEEAQLQFRAAREGKNADAMTALAAMLMSGDGVDKDPTLAVEWLRWAAEKNHADAQWRLGLAYVRGEGVIKNMEDASRLIQLSVAQGNPDAQYHWALLLERQVNHAQARTQALGFHEAAALQGHLQAQLHLAYLLRAGEVMPLPDQGNDAAPAPALAKAGRRGTAPHLVRSLDFFRGAADQGHAEAQFEVGQMFAQGLGTAQQFEEAAAWYLLAAKQGHAKAQFHLGFLYSHGQGVEQDYVKAYQWYCISDQCGYALAKKNVALIGKKLEPGEREMAKWRAESFVFGLPAFQT